MCSDCKFPITTAKKGKMEVEYGSVAGVRFMDSANVKMLDSDGNEVKCGCGKPAGAAAIGKTAFVAWCSDCSPSSKQETADFIYKPHCNPGKLQITDSWMVSSRAYEGC